MRGWRDSADRDEDRRERDRDRDRNRDRDRDRDRDRRKPVQWGSRRPFGTTRGERERERDRDSDRDYGRQRDRRKDNPGYNLFQDMMTCFEFVRTGKCSREDCRFHHDQETLKKIRTYYDPNVDCWFYFSKGYCLKDDACPYAHGKEHPGRLLKGGRSGDDRGNSRRERSPRRRNGGRGIGEDRRRSRNMDIPEGGDTRLGGQQAPDAPNPDYGVAFGMNMWQQRPKQGISEQDELPPWLAPNNLNNGGWGRPPGLRPILNPLSAYLPHTAMRGGIPPSHGGMPSSHHVGAPMGVDQPPPRAAPPQPIRAVPPPSRDSRLIEGVAGGGVKQEGSHPGGMHNQRNMGPSSSSMQNSLFLKKRRDDRLAPTQSMFLPKVG